jgi:ferredoxin
MVKYGAPTMVSSGYIAKVDEALCTACAACKDICPFGAIHMNEKAVVKWETCMGCGVCEGQCPGEAISLVRDERKVSPWTCASLAQNKLWVEIGGYTLFHPAIRNIFCFSWDISWLRAVFHCHFFAIPAKVIRYLPIPTWLKRISPGLTA